MTDETTTGEIDRFRHALFAVRERFPNLRIGQIIGNALPNNFQGDPYYVENEELIEALWAYASKDFSDV